MKHSTDIINYVISIKLTETVTWLYTCSRLRTKKVLRKYRYRSIIILLY